MASSARRQTPADALSRQGGVPERSSGLSEKAIVAAALEIIAERGVGGLSMRLLSDRLGVALGATYRHVPDKHQLLRLVAAELYAKVHPPEAVADEFEQVRLVILEIHDLLAAYPGMAAYMGQYGPEFASPKLARLIIEPLCAAGLTWGEAYRITFALVLLTAGHLLYQQPAELESDAAAAFAEGVDLMLSSARARAHRVGDECGSAPV